jgi:hypothetical protein
VALAGHLSAGGREDDASDGSVRPAEVIERFWDCLKRFDDLL